MRYNSLIFKPSITGGEKKRVEINWRNGFEFSPAKLIGSPCKSFVFE